MGRTYWFECSRCGYRTTVCGGPDAGKDLAVVTIACRDCKTLHDAVVRCRVSPAPPGLATVSRNKNPPRLQAVLGNLPATDLRTRRWETFPPRCPLSDTHRVSLWQHPGKCPRCGVYLEKNVLPYRLWD